MYVLVFVYLFIYLLSRTKIKFRNLYIITAILFACLGACYVLREGADLRIHYQSMDIVRNYGFGYFNKLDYWAGLYFYKVLILIVSKFPSNNWLPTITAFLGYIITGRYVHSIYKDFKLTRNVAILMYLSLISFIEFEAYVNGIRTALAYTIVAYFLYLDLVKNEKRLLSFVFYIIAMMLHPTVFIFIVLRYLSIFINKYNKTISYLILVVWSRFVTMLTTVLNRFSSISIFATIINKLYGYTEDATNVQNIIPNTYYIIMMIIALFICGVLVYLAWRSSKEKSLKQFVNYDVSIFNVFVYGIFAFMIGSVVSYHIFLRTSCMIKLMSPVIIGIYCSKRGGVVVKNRDIQLLKMTMLGAILYNIVIVSNHIQFSISQIGGML